MGLRGDVKPCEWVHMSMETLEMLEDIATRRVSRYHVTKCAARNELIPPSM